MHTEGRKIIAALRINEERYLGLLINLEAGIVVHAPDTSIIMHNAKASELLGLSNEQMMGKKAIDPAWKFVDVENNTLSHEDYPVNRVLTSKKSIKSQVLGIHSPIFKDVIWVTVNGFPIYNSTGDCSEVVISFVDISARKLAEIEAKSHKKILEEMIEVRTNELIELIELNKAKYYDNDFLKKVRICVLENINVIGFDIDTLAAKLFMSRSTLQRKIKRESGLKPAQFIRQIRLEKAHYYIQSKTHRTLAETAYAVGFTHAGYFSKLYKEYCADKVGSHNYLELPSVSR